MTTRQKARRPDPLRLYAVVGTVVIILTLVIVYVSYRATNGLPFESAYKVTVDVPSANRLVATNEVRIGGVRVGRVVSVEAMPRKAGSPPFTRARLALEDSVRELPVDTRVSVRPSSALGATFVDLSLGKRSATVPPDGRLPLSNARPTVDLVDLLDIFDRSTSKSIQRTFRGLGGGLAGRGAALNSALVGIDRLLPAMDGASRTLAAPETRLRGFIQGYESFAGALAPVSEPLAGFVGNGAATFAALDRGRVALGRIIEVLPSTERATTAGFNRVAPSLERLSRLLVELRRGGALLPRTLRNTNATLAEAVTPFRQTPRFANALGRTFTELRRASRKRSTDGSIRKLTEISAASKEILEVLAPAQIHCDVIGLWGVDFGKTFVWGGGDAQALGNFAFASVGAENSIFQQAKPSRDLGVNYLPNENAQECESGNEPPVAGGPPHLSNPPGLQSNVVPLTAQPPGVRERAIAAGLQDPTGGGR